MSSVKNKFSILTLVLLSTQFVPQVLRPSASSELLDVEGPAPSWQVAQPCALQDVPSALKGAGAASQAVATKDGWQAPYRLMSAALWPLDLMKKASVYVLKSPYLFLMATSALLPGTSAYQPRGSASRHPIVYDSTASLSPMRLGLTEAWDTTTCQGRALWANETQTIQRQKPQCHQAACSKERSHACNDPVSRRGLRYDDALHFMCDDTLCAPHSVNRGWTSVVREDAEACMQEVCQQTGRPYTGHFSCVTSVNNLRNTMARNKIDEILLKANACFETFCQTYAQKTCPKEASWWQSLFGYSPCNDELCVGRFVPNENKEVSPGVFKSLETLGQEAKNKCTKSLGRRRYHEGGVCRYLSLEKPDATPPMSQRDTDHLLRFSRQRG